MKNKVSIVFIFPALFFYLLIRIIPMIQGLFYSFTNWDGLSKNYRFVGFDNFIEIFRDQQTLDSFRITFVYMFIVVISVNVIGVLYAVLLNDESKSSIFFRNLYFFPIVLSQVAVAFLWKNLYSIQGPINYLFKILLGKEFEAGWLMDSHLALYSICATEIWRSCGFNIVLIFAALQTIPNELYESATIDGCNARTKFIHITFPLLIPGLGASIVLSTIGALKQFDLIRVMTDGGPLNSTMSISLRIIEQAVSFNRNGYAAAIAFVLFIVILLITGIQNSILRKREVEY